MNYDEYQEVLNGDDTYKQIAKDLIIHKHSVIVGWTDGKYDHRDIIFTLEPVQYGHLQRGLGHCRLYVGIIPYSCCGFLIEWDADNRKDDCYLMEKLKLHTNSCDNAICRLINGVIHEIDNLTKEK